MEGRIYEELLLKIAIFYTLAAIIGAWLAWKLLRWVAGKVYFHWRSRGAGIVFADPAGPIEEVRWGWVRIAGTDHPKDIRCIGIEVSPWTDRKGHLLEAAMITGLDTATIDILILGMGVDAAIRPAPGLFEKLKEQGFREVVALPTREACARFNELHRTGKRVALLAHSTC
ncbi:MAG TPA: Mth938-like domain-containing protein [Candidatus Ozemobacteraceae bacterium]